LQQSIIEIHKELIEQCKLNDRGAQFKLYSLYSKSMLNTAYRVLGNEEDAKDVLQESFLKAFNNLHRFQYRSSFGAWLKRIVVNTAINHAKKKGLNIVSDLKNVSESAVSNETEVDENVALSIEAAKEALQQLPTGYRTVLSLYLIEGYDHKEIAETLGVSISTSLTQYSRGKKKLIQLIKNNTSYERHRKVL
jgi:RNA polymerase sigma factor (sigma-70 family)